MAFCGGKRPQRLRQNIVSNIEEYREKDHIHWKLFTFELKNLRQLRARANKTTLNLAGQKRGCDKTNRPEHRGLKGTGFRFCGSWRTAQALLGLKRLQMYLVLHGLWFSSLLPSIRKTKYSSGAPL